MEAEDKHTLQMDDMCKHTCDKLVSEMASEDFVLTPEMFELVILAIVNEIERSVITRELRGEEKREIGNKIIKMVLTNLKDNNKIPVETYNAFISILYYVAISLFTTAKDEWKNNSEVAHSTCFFCF